MFLLNNEDLPLMNYSSVLVITKCFVFYLVLFCLSCHQTCPQTQAAMSPANRSSAAII